MKRTKLTRCQAQCVMLSLLGLRRENIARVLGISPKGVYKRLVGAKKTLGVLPGSRVQEHEELRLRIPG